MLAHLSKTREDQGRVLAGVAVFSIAGLALMIRIIGLGAESAWIDEAYSINLAGRSIAQIIQGTAADQHPPLYYLLLHFWMLLGDSVAHARLLSVFLGTLNIVQMMEFGHKLGKERLGIGVGMVLALSPLHIWYSQETRQYMLLALLATASSIELWKILQGGRRWVLYWLFSVLALYTQYFAIFIFLAQGIIVALCTLRQRKTHIILPWLIAVFGLGLAFIPWAPIAVNQFKFHTMPWIGEPGTGQVRDVALTLLFGSGIQILPDALRWIGLLVLGVVIAWAIIYLRKANFDLQSIYLYIGLWAGIPLLAISFVSYLYPVFQLKQFLILLPPLLLAAVAITMIIPKPWGGLFFAALVLAGGLTSVYQQTVTSKDDWRGASIFIEKQAIEGDLVYANPAASKLALEIYWTHPIPFAGYPANYDILRGGWEGEPVAPDTLNEHMVPLAALYERIWLLEFFPEFWDSHQYIPSWLSEHGRLANDLSFGKIRLRLFTLTP